MTMADYIANFGRQVSSVTAPTSFGSNSGGNLIGGSLLGLSKQEATVQDATKTGFWGFVNSIFDSEKRVSVDNHGAGKATVRVQDATAPSAGNLIRGTLPERRYNATQVGDKLIVQETANAGTGALGQILGTPGDSWTSSSWGEF
jgi:hypothetical protein